MTRRDKIGRVIPTKSYNIDGRDKALAAARYIAENKANRNEAAAKFDANVGSVSAATLILQEATPEEYAALMAAEIGMRDLADKIRTRMPKGELRKARQKIVLSQTETERLEFEKKVWADLRRALEAISGMPQPVDVVKIVRRNRVRGAIVDRHLMTAFQWITDFSDAWTK